MGLKIEPASELEGRVGVVEAQIAGPTLPGFLIQCVWGDLGVHVSDNVQVALVLLSPARS